LASSPTPHSLFTPELIVRLLAALAAIVVAACATATSEICAVGGAVTQCGSVTGVVIAVEGAGPTSVEGFTLRTAEGTLYEFAVQRLEVGAGGKPAPHLREHQLSSEPIVVEYKVENGRHVALYYTDAE
jgi:hypothetical protein